MAITPEMKAVGQRYLDKYGTQDAWSLEYYNNVRTHLSLDRNSPVPRAAELPSQGKVVSIPQVGGLHHLYQRVA